MSMLNEVRPIDESKRDRSLMGRIKDLIPWKGDDTKEVIRKLVYLTAVIVLIYSLFDVIEYKFGNKTVNENKDFLSDLYNQGLEDEKEQIANNTPAVVKPDPGPDDQQNGDSDNAAQPDSEVPSQPSDPEALKYPAGMLPRFRRLYDINPDVIGWLSIDTIFKDSGEKAIDYPVMQGNDNDYYLNHTIMNVEEKSGALFADYHVKITGSSGPRNTIIYGHNMGSGDYFAKLHDYKKRVSFLSDNRLIKFSTLWEESEYIIFGCFLTGINADQDNIPIFRYHVVFDFENIVDFDYWYANVMYRSYYTSDIECTPEDEYITLSTCSTEIYDSRFVVVARKLREGEDPNRYTYYSNPKARKPAAFYEAYGMSIPKDNGPDYKYYGKQNVNTEGTN